MTGLAAVPKKEEPLSLDFDPESLTIGEIEDLERISETRLSQIIKDFQAQDYTAKELMALVWVIQRRSNPEYTLEEARSVKVSALAVGADASPSS